MTDQAMLIGAILATPQNAVLLDESRRVRTGDFSDPFLRLCWAKIVELRDARLEVDTLTLVTSLRVAKQPDDQVRRAMTLDAGIPRVTSVRGVSENLVRAGTARDLSRILAGYAEQLQGGDDLERTADRARTAIEQALARTQDSPVVPIGDLIDEVEEELYRQRNERGVVGLRTGLPALDTLLGGMRERRLYVFAARTSDGKTTMAAQIGITVATAGKRVMLFSLEMDNRTLTERLAVRAAATPKRLLFLNPALADDAYTKLVAGARSLSGKSLMLCDRPGLTVADVRSYCALERMRNGLDLVIVDHAQIVASEQSKKGDKDRGRYLELRLIAESLREMAKEWAIPVVLMAQMNPAAAERKDKRPRLSEIRESNDMGNTADAAVLIYQKRNEETQEVESTSLIVAKNRHGRRGEVAVEFEADLHDFAEAMSATRVQDGRDPFD